ncbi:MAG TPA: hypothetical protein VM915_17280 [Verrucomicrobiae bacterium]|jgi:hypothetical protein|nr:hypothetical protein [Verrucomicrobiae bacterium]
MIQNMLIGAAALIALLTGLLALATGLSFVAKITSLPFGVVMLAFVILISLIAVVTGWRRFAR